MKRLILLLAIILLPIVCFAQQKEGGRGGSRNYALEEGIGLIGSSGGSQPSPTPPEPPVQEYVWGMDINQSTGEITYLDDAVGKQPVRINSQDGSIDNWDDTSSSWKSFVYDVAKPCMLKSDGTVDYYLNRDNQNYKEDGVTVSDIADANYVGNAMVELKKLYIKITEPETDVIRVRFATSQVDSGYTAYAFTDGQGNVRDKVYYGMFYGSLTSGKIRSICAGTELLANYNSMADATAFYDSASALNGSGWTYETYPIRNHINLLTVMVMKTLQVSHEGFAVANPQGVDLSTGIDSSLVDKNAFATVSRNRFKLFWIRDFFINGHLPKGIMYDKTNSQWKYKTTAPFVNASFSGDYSSYSNCSANNLVFSTDSSGKNNSVISKMAVSDNMLFPYEDYLITQSASSNPALTVYGNSYDTCYTATTFASINPVTFGAHILSLKFSTQGYNNIWNLNIIGMNEASFLWKTQGIVGVSLIYIDGGL